MLYICLTISTKIFPSGRKRRMAQTWNKKAQSSTVWLESYYVPSTYLQRYLWIHSKFGDFISPRQEFLSFVVQIIIEDCPLGWKFYCFHLFMPPPTEFSLRARKLRRTREILIADLEVILNTYKAPPNPVQHSICHVKSYNYKWDWETDPRKRNN